LDELLVGFFTDANRFETMPLGLMPLHKTV